MIAPPADHRPPPDGWRARMAVKPERPPKGYSEHQMQVELVAWTIARAGEHHGAKDLSFLFAVPNQGERSKATRGRMIREGLKAGVPDLILPVPRAGFCGAALELKIHPNKPSDSQAAWLDALEAIGWRCAVAYTLDEAKNFLASYIQPPTGNALHPLCLS